MATSIAIQQLDPLPVSSPISSSSSASSSEASSPGALERQQQQQQQPSSPSSSLLPADTIFSSSEYGLDKIEVLQRSASMDITYALMQERNKKERSKNHRGDGTLQPRSRSSHVVGRGGRTQPRPSSPLARSLNKRHSKNGTRGEYENDGDEEDEYDRQLRALNQRWQALLVEDVEKLRGPIKTTKTSSTVTNQDDDTIQVKNTAVNYKPSAQSKENDKKRENDKKSSAVAPTAPTTSATTAAAKDHKERDDAVAAVVGNIVAAAANATKSDDKIKKRDEVPLSTDVSTASSQSVDKSTASSAKKATSTKRKSRFFSLLNRKKAEEEKRYAEIPRINTTATRDRYQRTESASSTASGFFSNKNKQTSSSTSSHNNHNGSGNKRNSNKHFSLTPFPTPPRSLQTESSSTTAPPAPNTVTMNRDAVSDVSSMSVTASTLTTTSKTSASITTAASMYTTKTESSTDEILRDLSMASSSSASMEEETTTELSKKPSIPKAASSASTAPTKEQIAAAIANPEKSLKRARRYRKEADRLLNSVMPDSSNIFARCTPQQENPHEFQGRAKKAYQYAAEARRIYDLLENAEAAADPEVLQLAKEKAAAAAAAASAAKVKKEKTTGGPSSAQSCSSDDTTFTESTTFSEKMAREDLQDKMKELRLFSEFDLSSPKMPITCNKKNNDDHLGAIYAAEAQRIMRTFSKEQQQEQLAIAEDGAVVYASPVPSYEEMSVITSATTVTEKNRRAEHKARMAELQLFTTESITSSLQSSLKRAVETMGLVRQQQQQASQNHLFNLFRRQPGTNLPPKQVKPIQAVEDHDDEDDGEGGEEEEETVTSGDVRFRGYNTSCQLGMASADDATEASYSTAGLTTLKSGKESVVSNDDDDDSSSGHVSQSLYTVDEDDASSDDDQSNAETANTEERSNAETANSAADETDDSDDDDDEEEEEEADEDESVASGTTHSSESTGSSRSDHTANTLETNNTGQRGGFSGWIPGF